MDARLNDFSSIEGGFQESSFIVGSNGFQNSLEVIEEFVGKVFKRIAVAFASLFSVFRDLLSFPGVKAIAPNFFLLPIEEQREAHEQAKKYLKDRLPDADICFVRSSIRPIDPGSSNALSLKINLAARPLSPKVFSWERTFGVQGDIQRDGKRFEDNIIIYGTASQFNSSESIGPFTPKPGAAVAAYKKDPTQGPAAQLQFSYNQVEEINKAANIGYNALCNVFDEETKTAVQHGYLTPLKGQAGKVLEQLKSKGHLMELLCIGSKPRNRDKIVYQILTSAPVYKYYFDEAVHDERNREKIQFTAAYHAYRAQFSQAIALAKRDGKPVILKPAALGLGAFGNDCLAVSKAFYKAAKELEDELEKNNVGVRLQVFEGANKVNEAMGMAKYLKLKQKPNFHG